MECETFRQNCEFNNIQEKTHGEFDIILYRSHHSAKRQGPFQSSLESGAGSLVEKPEAKGARRTLVVMWRLHPNW